MALSKSKAHAMATRLKGADKTIVTKENYQSTLMAALGQYNQLEDRVLSKAVINYVRKTDKTKASILLKAANWELVSAGKLVMILDAGGYLSEDHMNVLQQTINKIHEKYSQVMKEEAKDDVKESKPK